MTATAEDTRRLARWHRGVHAIGALAALGVQLFLWLAERHFAPRRLLGDEGRYLREALAIWQGDPVATNWIWPPLQKWFLAPLVGPLDGQIWLVQIVQTLFLFLAALCLRRIWRELDPRPLAADIAFWLFLSSPALMAFGLYLWPEPMHQLLLLGALWLVACHGHRTAATALAGAAVALALYSKNLLAPFWPAFLLLLLRRPLRRSHWRPAVVFVLALLVVAGPGLWRGWQATGKPLIADSSTFNVHVGLIDSARTDYADRNAGVEMARYWERGATPRARNATLQREIDAEIAARGGLLPAAWQQLRVQYFRLFSAQRTVLSQLPGPRACGYRGTYTLPAHWVGAAQLATRTHYLAVLALAAFGFALWRRPRMLLLWIVLFAAYQLALFLFLHVKARYLLPLMPFIFGFAASALASVLPGGATASAPLRWRGAPWRLAAGMLLAAVLLFLALAGPWLDGPCAGGA